MGLASFKMAKTVLKSLFKKPATAMYPAVPREWTERTRGHVSIIEENCILCGICARKCPTNAKAKYGQSTGCHAFNANLVLKHVLKNA